MHLCVCIFLCLQIESIQYSNSFYIKEVGRVCITPVPVYRYSFTPYLCLKLFRQPKLFLMTGFLTWFAAIAVLYCRILLRHLYALQSLGRETAELPTALLFKGSRLKFHFEDNQLKTERNEEEGNTRADKKKE